jgi:hypothetical protein
LLIAKLGRLFPAAKHLFLFLFSERKTVFLNKYANKYVLVHAIVQLFYRSPVFFKLAGGANLGSILFQNYRFLFCLVNTGFAHSCEQKRNKFVTYNAAKKMSNKGRIMPFSSHLLSLNVLVGHVFYLSPAFVWVTKIRRASIHIRKNRLCALFFYLYFLKISGSLLTCTMVKTDDKSKFFSFFGKNEGFSYIGHNILPRILGN